MCTKVHIHSIKLKIWFSHRRKLSSFFSFFLFLNNFLQLYCPNGISPMGNSGRFPRGKSAATESRYPTDGACWVFYCFYNPPKSDIDYRIFNVRTDVNNACDCTRAVYGHCKRVCTISWLWEKKNPLPHRGIEPASAACRSDALSTELHPCLLVCIMFRTSAEVIFSETAVAQYSYYPTYT